MTHYPTSEQVILAWLATLPGITSSMVANTLPKDTKTWAGAGFITATVAGGALDPDSPVRAPLVQLDCWACSTNSQRPPWGKATQLAEQIVAGGWQRTSGHQTDVTVRTGYAPARIFEAWAVTEPQRLYDDASSFAHVRVDVRLTWAETP